MGPLVLLLAVVFGTWNGEWFPSGRAEHRANPEVEAATIRAAGRILRKGIDAVDPEGRDDVLLVVNEVRGPRVANELVRAIGRTNLAVAVVSGYRRRDRFDQQQDVILTTLPVASASWSRFRDAKADTPPRGYAFAKVALSPAVTANVYAVHLKSNYGATTEKIASANRRKRANAIGQILEIERPKRGRTRVPVAILGDFNADPGRKEFANETIFADLKTAGFADALELLPPDERGTHPNKRYGNSSLDHILLRDLVPQGPPKIISSEAVSDHDPVFVRLGNVL